jgi:hypothetical protein
MRTSRKFLKKVARPERFELPTLWFEARCSIQLSYGRVPPSYQNSRAARGGVRGVRSTMCDVGLAPERIARNDAARRISAGRGDVRQRTTGRRRGKLVGLGRLELPTSPLSGVRSSHLSYRPNLLAGNILRDLAHSSNNGAACVSLAAEAGKSARARTICVLGSASSSVWEQSRIDGRQAYWRRCTALQNKLAGWQSRKHFRSALTRRASRALERWPENHRGIGERRNQPIPRCAPASARAK